MTEEFDLSISVVIYRNSLETVSRLFNSIANTILSQKVFVIDNFPKSDIERAAGRYGFTYIPSAVNLGFGAGHNIAIRKSIGLSKYHLIINPDIYFGKGALEKIFYFMEENSDIGLALPKVLYPDGSIQHLCRLLPTPLDLLMRKLNLPVLTGRQNHKYELRSADYNKIMEAPYLSGCFMFIRNVVFKKVGFFDERFFMYLEDVDLSRRIHSQYRTIYYPEAAVYHQYERGSSREIRLLGYLIISAIRYFNKWGWFFDRERSEVNNFTIKCGVL